MGVKRRICTGGQDAEGAKSGEDTESWAHDCLRAEKS